MSDKKLGTADVLNLIMIGGAVVNAILVVMGIDSQAEQTQNAIAQIPQIAQAAVETTHQAVAVAADVKEQVNTIMQGGQVANVTSMDKLRLTLSGGALMIAKPLQNLLKGFFFRR